MEFSKKVVMLVLFIVFFGIRMTGGVIINPGVVENCSDSEIENVWGQFFEESGSGILIFKDVESECKSYTAIKDDGAGQFWFLFENYTEGRSLKAYYFNLEAAAYAEISGISNQESANDFVSGLSSDDLIDWDVENEAAAGEVFDEFFAFAPEAFSFDADEGTYFYTKEDSVGDYSVTSEAELFQNESSIKVDNFYETEVSFKEDIKNFTFEQNSSWNFAFDVSDHFVYENIDDASMSYWGGSTNNGGVLINWSISDDGKVSFKPKKEYLGSKEFQMAVNGIYSNRFKVTIVDEINLKPRLKEEIPQLYVPANGSVKVYLDIYFEDPNDDNLSYRTSTLGNLDVTFEDDVMTVKAKPNFSKVGYEIFVVYASDGDLEKPSNDVEVFLKINNSDLVDLTNVSESSLFVSDEEENSSGFLEESGFNAGGLRIFVWVFVLVFVLGLLGALIYFLFLKPRKKEIRGTSESVQNYLKEIGVSKSSAPASSSDNVQKDSQNSGSKQTKDNSQG